MKPRDRNILRGTVVEVTRGATTARVEIDVGGVVITTSIANEAVDELRLAKGVSTAVMVETPISSGSRRTRRP
jgi:molybdopterin-binding protein